MAARRSTSALPADWQVEAETGACVQQQEAPSARWQCTCAPPKVRSRKTRIPCWQRLPLLLLPCPRPTSLLGGPPTVPAAVACAGWALPAWLLGSMTAPCSMPVAQIMHYQHHPGAAPLHSQWLQPPHRSQAHYPGTWCQHPGASTKVGSAGSSTPTGLGLQLSHTHLYSVRSATSSTPGGLEVQPPRPHPNSMHSAPSSPPAAGGCSLTCTV